MRNIIFGNWRAESLDDLNIWILDESDNYIAEIVSKDDVGRFIRSASKRLAAAHLMAAAPKLLRALKKLRTDPGAWREADAAIDEAEHGWGDIAGGVS